jgi:antitoxin component YwqK of YwqJK toxin-antitoxin module
MPFSTSNPTERFTDIRGSQFDGRILGRESTWVHLESDNGQSYTISIENFPKKEKERILKQARKLKTPSISIQVVDDSQLVLRDQRFHSVQDGQPFTGRIIVRDKLGQTAARLSCYSGQLHGVCTYFEAKGQRSAEMHYSQGLLHGIAVYWHPNGQMQSRGFHLNGEKDGQLETFHLSGKRESRSRWHQGKPKGKHVQWHENGHPARETTYWNENVRSKLEWNEFGELTKHERL